MIAKDISSLTDEVLDDVVGGCAIAASGEAAGLPSLLCLVD